MIARIWHGKTHGSLGNEYFDYINKTGVRALRATEGNRSVYVLKITSSNSNRMSSTSKCFWPQMARILIMRDGWPS